MRIEACRIHGRDRVMVGEMELPPIGPDELLLRVVSSSMCLSTYKALCLGEEHKRVPSDISEVPVMTGHEFAGVLEEFGESLSGQFSPSRQRTGSRRPFPRWEGPRRLRGGAAVCSLSGRSRAETIATAGAASLRRRQIVRAQGGDP